MIYYRHLKKDFPASETKPFSAISRFVWALMTVTPAAAAKKAATVTAGQPGTAATAGTSSN